MFAECTSFNSIVFPKTITVIPNNTFYKCESLEEVQIPATVNSIGEKAFASNVNLSKVVFNSSKTAIGNSAFRDDVLLSNVTLPSEAPSIGDYAFYNCDSLTKIEIPNSVSYLGSFSFASCETLKEATVVTGVTELKEGIFRDDPLLSKVTLPYSLTKIGKNVFANDTALKEITIPRAVTSIDNNVFSYYRELTIYGVKGTYAETFANANGARFVERNTPATNVSLTPKTLTLYAGEKSALNLSVTPAAFTDEVSWMSSNENVATVSANGVVTAKKAGQATIKVYVGDDLNASCTLTVIQPVTSISVSGKSSMQALETQKLSVYVSPSDASNKEVAYQSSDPTVASIDEQGNVTSKKKGTAKITVTAKDGRGASATYTITVTNNAVKADTINQLESPHNYANNCTDYWLYTLKDASSLDVTFNEKTELEDGFDYLYIYDANGKQIGKYTGTELAGQTITVPGNTVKIQFNTNAKGTAWGFKVDKINDIDASASLDKVTINKSNLELATKKTETLKLSNVPSGATVTWSSSKPTVATVDKNGKVEAKTYGKAVITASVSNGVETVKRTCNVQTRFYDVADPTMSGYTQIYWAADNGITQGYNGGEYFGPTQKCTRQEFAIFLWRALGQPKPKSTTLPFSDTKDLTGSSLNAIAWASENGIIKGFSDNTFKPKNNVTREQIVIMIWRAAGQPKATKEPTFADIGSLDKSSSAYKGIAWASENGIVQGFYADNTFRPKDNSKRNQVVIMLYRYVTKFVNNK